MTSKHGLVVVLGVVLLVMAIAWLRSGRQYPEVTSQESLQLMRALYTACSSQNPARLAAVAQKLKAAQLADQIGEEEVEAFRAIFALASADDWQQAAAESYRFAQDQVR